MIVISTELLLRAAKFIQNHKIKADVVVFNAETEVMKFLDKEVKEIAWQDYNNTPGKKNYYIAK